MTSVASPPSISILLIDDDSGCEELVRGGPAVRGVARDPTESKRIQTQAIRADRAAAMGIVAAGLAHEINNPLSYVTGNLDFLHREISRLAAELRGPTPEAAADARAGWASGAGVTGDYFRELLESIEDAREGADRIRDLVLDLKFLGRDDDQLAREVRVEPLLDAVIKTLWDEICARARLVRSYEPVSVVRANPMRLTQVFLNLVANALQALSVCPPGEGEIKVSLRPHGDGRVLVEIWDNGPETAPELWSRLFEPCRGDASSGQRRPEFGLSMCRTLLTEMGGEITLESRAGGESVYRVALPPAQREQAPRRTRAVPSRPSSGVRSA